MKYLPCRVYNTVSVYKRARTRTWIILWRLSHCCVFALIAWSFWRTVDASYVYSSSSSLSSLSTSRRIVRVSRVHRIAADNSHNRCHCESEYIPIVDTCHTHSHNENILWFFVVYGMCWRIRWPYLYVRLHTAYMASYGMFVNVACVCVRWMCARARISLCVWVRERENELRLLLESGGYAYVSRKNSYTIYERTEKARWHHWYGHGQCVTARKSDNNEVGANMVRAFVMLFMDQRIIMIFFFIIYNSNANRFDNYSVCCMLHSFDTLNRQAGKASVWRIKLKLLELEDHWNSMSSECIAMHWTSSALVLPSCAPNVIFMRFEISSAQSPAKLFRQNGYHVWLKQTSVIAVKHLLHKSWQ